MSKTIRESNFELLRAISCFMIIVLHYLNGSMGGALSNVSAGSFNYYLSYFVESLCIVSVNCFVLISGYFLITKKSTNISKIIKLILTLLFYSVILFAISILIGAKSFSLKELLLAIAPFLSGRRWFVETYIILFLFAPYLNKFLKYITKKEYQTFLIIYLLFFYIWPTFLPSPPVTDGGYGITNFILMYAIGGYIKLHGIDRIKLSKITCIFLYFIISICTFILSTKFGRAWNYNTIFNVFGSVFLFLFFMKFNFKSRFINTISSLSFGIFILHSDPMMRDTFYSIMNCKAFYNSPLFIVHLIVCCLLSYIIFAFIDYIREISFKKTIYKIIDKIKLLNYNIEVE